MSVSRTSAEPGKSLTQSSSETGYGRGKTVTSACERCRRRKIRCDGETPCATCRRFRINCVRIQKNDTQALEQRVRQLEAQIAEFTGGISSTQGQEASKHSTQTWPNIPVATDFGSPGPAISIDELGQIQPPTLSHLEIPSIQVVDYADTLSPVSPVSPVSLSQSPLLRPLAPPQSTPLDSVDSLRPPVTVAISPPMAACPSPNQNIMPYLSPRSLPGPSRSRSSSISSLGLDADWTSAPGDISGMVLESDIDPSIFDLSPVSPSVETSWTPSKFEAEMLLDKFFDRVQSSPQNLAPYPLNRGQLFEFLDICLFGVNGSLPCIHGDGGWIKNAGGGKKHDNAHVAELLPAGDEGDAFAVFLETSVLVRSWDTGHAILAGQQPEFGGNIGPSQVDTTK
ncbi:hypothetical protein AN2826.2 [Aspergillus nidulans FGSC A4]|uniref:Zn(II)2Cys6 transcription factor (Eurofung) n=1 Tax=Emericella nidulans (strain FGSC A4 / ATCC 38163 / CBS 112.46 / NRRL 194 / M139) TaxID=227321 RepID=Q5B9F4_EMENI|nr:hypothetical protein [Aspergillus nidulans FGSC A4]EAA63397.1 hypothetical protein AN2826.2 [Aspergillus nidulans FGSC A4]CBF83929.1 TPA: Putative Zn(II)2Cys6 transcription factor (Eurofung) [Aspergillus nidulans FGSC A4]|eukprot:XP_660430.1 hypothetical protein AN2826.2 [Aspergillus nidulans FGSC A4]